MQGKTGRQLKHLAIYAYSAALPSLVTSTVKGAEK